MILLQDARLDRAIRDEHGDKLGRGPFVESLVRALVRDEVGPDGKLTARRSTGYVVGLTGRWGLGKSSVVSLLSNRLGSMDKVLVANFNPWLLKGGDDLLTGFFNSVRTAVGKNAREELDALRADIDSYWGAINVAGTAIATAADPSGLLAKAFRWRPGKPNVTPETERKRLEDKIEKLGCAVVVLIDELDRVEDDDVRAVARLIKAVGEIKGVSYLVAYDPERVAEALGRGVAGAGERYLEKIIQHPIPLRPLFEEDSRALMAAAFEQHGTIMPEASADSEQEIFNYIVQTVQTPREIKRLIGAFTVLEEAVRGEINPYDVLGYCWLQTKSPRLRDVIAANPDTVVDDPGEVEIANRVALHFDQGRASEVGPILGDVATPHAELLQMLFPRFSDRRSAGEGDRLSRRRNLIRMLYLGNPPGMVRRVDVEAVWKTTGESLENELRRMQAEETIRPFIDRLDDLIPSLSESGDSNFWPTLSKTLVRGEDWLREPNTALSIANDAATVLTRQAMRDVRLISRIRHAIGSLQMAGDLIFVPWVLRKAMRAHGLSVHSRGESDQFFLDKLQTQTMMEDEFPKYRSAVQSGHILRRLPTLEPLFALLNASRWDDELRTSMTQQLEGEEAIGTFAGLLVPPGYASELSTINQICDADRLKQNLGNLLENADAFPDPWIRDCAVRLHRTLNGKDPLFDDD